MEIPADQPACSADSEIETENDEETEKERLYDETLQYLMHDKYPWRWLKGENAKETMSEPIHFTVYTIVA